MEIETDTSTDIKKKKSKFFDICDDQSYYEREGNMRNYVVCHDCGFIPIAMIDRETKFLDLHCKCRSPAIWVSFTEEEMTKIIDGK